MIHEHVQFMDLVKKNILDHAFLLLKNELGDRLAFQSSTKEFDAVFLLDGIPVNVIAKNEIRPHQILANLTRKNQDHPILIAANYITPVGKKLIRENGQNYVDRAGNIYFRLDPIYIFIEGRPTPAPLYPRTHAFSKTGVKVIFNLLHDPDSVNAPLRQLAKISGVSLGTVHHVINGLKESGLLIEKRKKIWIISDYQALLDRWQIAYNERLKPSLILNTFRSVDKHFSSNWPSLSLSESSKWGGEPAGDLLTGYLQPEVFTLYTHLTQREIIAHLRWIPDPNGDIHVFHLFWDIHLKTSHPTCAPAPIIYADLTGTGDSRCIETAHILYERFIQKD